MGSCAFGGPRGGLDAPPEWIHHVMLHCTFKECIEMPTLNKAWFEYFKDNETYWKLLCYKLAHERKLYIPPLQYCPGNSWKEFFQTELWPIREQFTEDVLRDDADAYRQDSVRFSVGVCVRFKPNPKAKDGSKDVGLRVAIPLHQRIPLVRAKYGNCSKEEALKHIMEEQGRTPVSDPWANCTLDEGGPTAGRKAMASSGKENVGACVGVNQQSQKATASIVRVKESESTVLAVAPGSGLREFKFDKVFDESATQKSVYDVAGRRIVSDFLNGFNGTIMVYGQTGSGKTYTMFGKPRACEDSSNGIDGTTDGPTAGGSAGGLDENASPGIVQRTCREVLDAVQARDDVHGMRSRLCVTYVEIHGQEVYDLLREGEVVGQSRVAGQRYVLDGHSEWPVDSFADVQRHLDEGGRWKRKAATEMNAESSRAHTIFILTLAQTDPKSFKKVVSKLLLVDLGGSERLSKSNVHGEIKQAGTVTWDQYYKSRRHFNEAVYINLGLATLRRCIEALNERQRQEQEAPPDAVVPHVYVPYQDTKLTMLLSASLGGNSKTVLIVTGSKETKHALETVQSLRFGEQCSSVSNTAIVSTASLLKAVAEIEAAIAACEKEIALHERWETRRVVRKDEYRIACGYKDGEEVVTTSVPVGAEIYRERLEGLLEKRRTLLGIEEDEKEEENKEGEVEEEKEGEEQKGGEEVAGAEREETAPAIPAAPAMVSAAT